MNRFIRHLPTWAADRQRQKLLYKMTKKEIQTDIQIYKLKSQIYVNLEVNNSIEMWRWQRIPDENTETVSQRLLASSCSSKNVDDFVYVFLN